MTMYVGGAFQFSKLASYAALLGGSRQEFAKSESAKKKLKSTFMFAGVRGAIKCKDRSWRLESRSSPVVAR
jgi:hypothetical protein